MVLTVSTMADNSVGARRDYEMNQPECQKGEEVEGTRNKLIFQSILSYPIL